MTTEQGRKFWTPEQEAEYQMELKQKRTAWEESKRYEAEAKRLTGLREEMDRYRHERLTDWMEHGGEEATFRQVWPQMQKEYLEEKRLVQDAKHQARLAEAEDQPQYHPHL